MEKQVIKKAVALLNEGKIIAYPTEGMYGLGCDPFNRNAVVKLVKLKKRQLRKGLILVGYSFDQFQDLVQKVPEETLAAVSRTWPGPITWVFPATEKAPKWITGNRHTLAIRVSAHPVVQELCRAFAKPLVSTSANLEGSAPITTASEVGRVFKTGIDLLVPGKIGDRKSASEIRDVETGKIIRPGIVVENNHP
jgi:L-threonylcarbamoyladenylate synthase